MNEYVLTITETLCRTVKVKANNYKDAKERVKELYYNSDIVLTGDDFQDVEIV